MGGDRNGPVSRPTSERGSELVSRMPSVGIAGNEFSQGQGLICQPVLAEASAFLALLASPYSGKRPDWPSGQVITVSSHGLSHRCSWERESVGIS